MECKVLHYSICVYFMVYISDHTIVHQRVGHTISMPILVTMDIVFEHVWWGLGFDSSCRIVTFDPMEVACVNMQPNLFILKQHNCTFHCTFSRIWVLIN